MIRMKRPAASSGISSGSTLVAPQAAGNLTHSGLKFIYIYKVWILIFSTFCLNASDPFKQTTDEKLALQLPCTDTVIEFGDINIPAHEVINNQNYNMSEKSVTPAGKTLAESAKILSFSEGSLRKSLSENGLKIGPSYSAMMVGKKFTPSLIFEGSPSIKIKYNINDGENKKTARFLLKATNSFFSNNPIRSDVLEETYSVSGCVTPPPTNAAILHADDPRICPMSHRRAREYQQNLLRMNIMTVKNASPRLMSEQSFFIIFPYEEPKERVSSGFYPGIDPFYIMCCPALNAPKFAYTLVKNGIYADNLTIEGAAQQYMFFLNYTLEENVKNTINYDKKIASVIDIFKVMYQGILLPMISSLS
jgi:hypothetical protein